MTVIRRNPGATLARSLKLNKTAAAVRAGLLTTTAMFALAGANAAFAQTCTPAAPAASGTTTCSGVFTDSVNNHFTDNTSITVVLDDTVTVDPGTGFVGIDLSAAGDITLDSSGVFNVDSADAIFVSGSTSATVGVYGDVYNYALDAGDNAIHVYSPGDVSLAIGSAVSTYGDAGSAYAVDAFSNAGDVTIDVQEYASVDATSYSGNALGIWSETDFGDIALTNDGDINAATTYGDYSWGTYLYAYGDISVANSGNIDASGDHYVMGVHMWAYFDAYVYNTGSITATGDNIDSSDYAWVQGVYAYSWDGYTDVINAGGSISASASADNTLYGAYATGVYAYGYYGASVSNSGDISADISGYYGIAAGIAAFSYNDVDVYNTGSVYAGSTGYYGAAYGVYVSSGDDASVINYGGDIAAYSYYGTAIGVYSYGADSSFLYNSGDISADAYVGTAAGAVVLGGNYAGIYNAAGGEISAYAYYGAAYGAVAVSGFVAGITNYGDISADAYVGASFGAEAIAAAYSFVENHGDISAYTYYGVAYGAVASAGVGAYIFNYGDISAIVHYGDAVGAEASAGSYAEIYNDGSIYAYAYYGSAIGAEVISGGSATVINYGDIEGYGVIGFGVGVYMDAVTSTYLLNTGTITGHAYPGYGYGYSIYSAGTSDDTVVNYGELNGSISLGYGDDSIWNYGDINLSDGQFIDMGTSVNPAGNYVYNAGSINFSGSNGIYMYGGTLYNSGILNMQDGDATTYVYFEGNLAGDGQLNVEIDGQAGTNDYMYIYGNVDIDSDTIINVDLLSLPTAQSTVYDLVGVSGDSGSGNFALGAVDFADNNFLDLEFTLIADVDATNATPDVYSLGIEVLGLSDPGTLAASVPGSNLAMIHTMVGTWRQRMGVIDSYRAHSLSLWARVFTSKGDFSPEHVADGFGQGGNFDWHQQTTGIEAGVDFAVTDNLSLGLVLAQMEADTDLNDAGVGDNEVEADSYGVYATWISGGWYLDASYRWTDFENRLSSVAGPMEAATDGETFNIEAGYAWTTGSGLKVEPQIQWTHTKIEAIDVLVGDISNFAQDDMDSSRGRIGLSFRKDFGDPDVGWMWTPYSTLSAVREFDGEARYYITDDFTGYTSMEGTSAMLELGFNARTGNVAVYGGLTWMDGGAYESHFGGHLGVRYTFGGEAPAPAPAPAPVQKTCAELDDDGDGVNNCDDRCPGSTAGSPVGADGCPVPPAPEPEPVMEPKPYRG